MNDTYTKALELKEESCMKKIIQEEKNSEKMLTQEDIKAMSYDKLLLFLKDYEGPGRTQRFNEKASSREKKEAGETYEYDFSWTWLTSYVKDCGIDYTSSQGWHVITHENTKETTEKEVIYIRKSDRSLVKKRTVEADAATWKDWDELLEGVPCKHIFMTTALQRMISDIRSGKIEIGLDLNK